MAEAVTEKNTAVYEVGRIWAAIHFHTFMPVRFRVRAVVNIAAV